MVQLDWLQQMRQARRLGVVRMSRRPLPSLDLAEVLEPRCVLSAVQTGIPIDDSVAVNDPVAPDDPTGSSDTATGDDSADPNAVAIGSDATNDQFVDFEAPLDGSAGGSTDGSSDGPPVKINFYSVGGLGDSATPSPYFTEAELHDYLLSMAKERWGGLFGQAIPQYDYGWPMYAYDDVAVGGAVDDAVPVMTTAASNNRVQSTTNNQVAGVDEADFVETDGRFIYVARGSGLTIVDTIGDSTLNVASKTSLNGNVVGEFLSGDRLTVITQTGYGGWYGGGGGVVRFAPLGMMMPLNWQQQTSVTVFDISDRTAPSVVQQNTLNGSFQSARAIGDTVYVIVQDQLALPEPLFTDTPVDAPVVTDPTVTDSSGNDGSTLDSTSDSAPTDGTLGPITTELPVFNGGTVVRGRVGAPDYFPGYWSPRIVSNRTYESFDDYVARVGDQIVGLSLPHAFTIGSDGSQTDLGSLTDATGVVRPQGVDPQSVLSVVSFDMTADWSGPASATSLLTTYGSTVYMTTDALYIATPEYHSDNFGWSSDTRIDRFTVDGASVIWQASGVVPGTLLNQFAMDEQDGYLHVATHSYSTQWTPSDPTAATIDWSKGSWSTINDNGLFVFDTAGDTLDQVGSVTGLATGEQLDAARFIGNTAYLVTFQQTDPLFTIDLTDPANPTVLGKLEIPGFSNYLQSAGDGLLFGIGQEREAGTWNSHTHVSLFNVSDATAPELVARQFLDENAQWTWSAAQFDSHALLYSPADGLLVVPVSGTRFDESSGNYVYDQLLEVLRIDATGITVVGEINSDTAIIRTVRIDNVLYAVSDSGITAYDLNDLSQIGQADLLVYKTPIMYFGGVAGGGPVVVEDSSSTTNSAPTDGQPGPLATPTSGAPEVLRFTTGSGAEPSSNSVATPSGSMSTAVVIPPTSTFIGMPSGYSGPGASTTLLALAAQVAQNRSTDLSRLSDLDTSHDEALASPASDVDASSPTAKSTSDTQEGTDSQSSDHSSESDTKTVDEFWQQVGEQLRDGRDPMPMDDSAPKSNAAQPHHADKAAPGTEMSATDSAKQRRTNDRSAERKSSANIAATNQSARNSSRRDTKPTRSIKTAGNAQVFQQKTGEQATKAEPISVAKR